MGKRVLVASGESSTIGSNGSTVSFPDETSDENLWADRPPKQDSDVRIVASLESTGNYSMRLMASFQDPDTGSVFNGVMEQFTPSDTLGASGGNQVVFRSPGKHVHHTWLEIDNGSSNSTMDVKQLALVWESA